MLPSTCSVRIIRLSKKKILEAVKYDLYKRYNYKVSVDFSGCNPVVAVGVPSLPYIIHTKHLHYEPDYEAQLPIILGLKTSDGEVLQFDLAKSGNVLIGGALKQGKTICIKNMIYCLERCKSKPQIIIFDFKRCGEYNDYKDRYTVSWDAELLGRIAVETVIGRMNRKEITEFSPLVIIIDDYDDLFEDSTQLN